MLQVTRIPVTPEAMRPLTCATTLGPGLDLCLTPPAWRGEPGRSQGRQPCFLCSVLFGAGRMAGWLGVTEDSACTPSPAPANPNTTGTPAISLSKRHTGLTLARASDRCPWQRQNLSEYLHCHQQTDKAYTQRSRSRESFPLVPDGW